MKIIFRSFLLILIFSPIIFGQSILFKNGQSGISLGYSNSSNNYSKSNGIGLIYSTSVNIDIGISYSKFSSFDNYLQGNSLVPNVSFVFRNNNNLGVLSLSIGYLINRTEEKTTDYLLKEHIYETKLSGLVVGGSATVVIFKNEFIALMPSLGISYSFISTNRSNNLVKISSKSMTAQMVFRYLGNGIGFYLSPAALVDLDAHVNAFSFGISLGVSYVLP